MAQAIINSSILRNIGNAAGLDSEDSVRVNYSGRGMYGSTCVGITGSTGDLIGFVAEVIRRDEWNQANDEQTDEAEQIHEFVRWIEDVSTDSMGYDSIFYWTHVAAEEGATDEPEDIDADGDW